jgi:hypothetical protein
VDPGHIRFCANFGFAYSCPLPPELLISRLISLLAFPIRKFLKRFPGQLSHSSLQVRDGDPLGIFQIFQRVQGLISRVASDVGSSRDVDHESSLWRHISLLCHGHSTHGTDGTLVEFAEGALQALGVFNILFGVALTSRICRSWPAVTAFRISTGNVSRAQQGAAGPPC